MYSHTDPDTALEWVTVLGHDLQDESCPPEINQLGRTLIRWLLTAGGIRSRPGITPTPRTGPPRMINNLIKRIKRVFGFTNFANYRVRSLLYAGRPTWDLLATITPTPR